MKKFSILLICLSLIPALYAQSEGGNKRFEHQKAIGDKKFGHFHFRSAIDHYKKALSIKRSAKVKLKLAETYRLLNEPQESEFWYSQAIREGAYLTDDDHLHYAQVLRANGKYEDALRIYEEHSHKHEWTTKHVDALKNTEDFYKNEHAYEIEWAPFNSPEKDFSPVYRNNEIIFVSSRETSGRKYMWDHSSFLELYTVDNEDEHVELFHKKINSDFHEGPSTFFDNGTKMFFSRNNFHNNKMGLSKDGINMIKIYYTESKGDDKWTSPVEFLYNSDEYNTAHPSITNDGRTLYFASDMPGGYGGEDIYKSEYKDGRWQHPVNLGAEINTPKDEMFPFIHKDEILYFASRGHEGLGGLDIFRVQVGKDHTLENMGFPLNTNADDFGISFYKDTNKAYFSSNRAGGMGDDDIYSVFLYDYVVDVTLVDAETKEPITSNGRIDVLKTLRTSNNDKGITVPKTTISFGVEKGTSFLVTGSADGYYQGNLILQVSDEVVKTVQRFSYEIPLQKLEGELEAEVLVVVNNDAHTQVFYATDDKTYNPFDGSLQELKKFLANQKYEIVKETYLTNILYDFDQYNIRSDAGRSLDKIIQYLKSDKELNIILESHTDVRGSNQYNQLLAKRRVESAMQYLIAGGIGKDRIFTGSHGEEKTIINCGDNCGEDEHQKNRRTEIRIEVKKRKNQKRLSAFSGE